MTYYSRKSTRLTGYDYSNQNYYFVTICTNNKACIFGTIKKLSKLGEIAKEEMIKISSYYTGIYIDNYIIMPNHIHAIVVMEEDDKNTKKPSLDNVIGSYKAGVTRRIRKIKPEIDVWQRSFHDHIIRNEKDYLKIWEYIQHNDQKWEADCFYPNR